MGSCPDTDIDPGLLTYYCKIWPAKSNKAIAQSINISKDKWIVLATNKHIMAQSSQK